MRIISTFGSTALAGYTIAIRIVIFTLLPAWGFSNAAATMVGQNLGANQPDRAEKSVWRTGYFNMMFMGTVMVVFFLFGDNISTFFTDEKEVDKHYAPDATAAIFWLKNRQPDKWRDKQEVEQSGVTQHVMLVPTADSVDDWEHQAKAQQDKSLGKDE